MNPLSPESKPDKTWLSSFLLVLGAFSIVVAVFVFVSGGFAAGLGSLATAAIFLALSRMLDYLDEIRHRLRRLEEMTESNREKKLPLIL